ncbi:MAG: haloacid dehalogenase-like hydrolase [Spirochaetes bacterium]|nr:haloacid dehalogenase-like hydrolase [Spirochaetota bacterium]
MNRNKKIIIWDFDGTMYPINPYDAECYLLKTASREMSLLKAAASAIRIRFDQKHLFSKQFKKYYIRYLMGCSRSLIDITAEYIASTIPKSETEQYHELKELGWKQYIISCGTYDICIKVLEILNISDCFTKISANKFIFRENRISGMNIIVNDGKMKPIIMEKILNEHKENRAELSQVIAVGDGYTDIPLLNRVKTPVLIDWDGGNHSSPANSKLIHISRPSEILKILHKHA